ncbi:hypothetical protein QNI16_23270 [Cytophagaceae bacterium YF14B1]|uniref:Uncharacterized protein n=1 Tax=Xanthocytophaga flava TaxID=3048013 RepID=A0AAE3QU04_9BACT|nr:hypothetical protein [Xanthocytophaga flavus]MDJ1483440.1 hypothetical protein [Xanthocytophaga flavus]
MKYLLCMLIALGGLIACSPLKHNLSQTPTSDKENSTAVTSTSVVQEQPAQAQTSITEDKAKEDTTPIFSATDILKKTQKAVNTQPEGLASTNRKALAETLRKPMGLSKLVLKATEKKIAKEIKKRRPAQQDGTILGLRPILFFSLVAVAVGIILLFIAGKSQFFSILTMLLLIGGLLMSLAAFLDII